MKIYGCYSDSHAAFVYRHFLPSIPTGIHVDLVRMPQDCEKGRFRDKGWEEMAKRKLAMCARAVQDNDVVFVSDVDARFYAKDAEALATDLIACLGDNDIAFQWDGEGKCCSGSWVAQPSYELWEMFNRAIELLPDHHGYDQPAMNAALEEFARDHVVKWGVLPERYWSQGAKDSKLWSPGMPVTPPSDLMVHQANWCLGIEAKLALLDAVQKAHTSTESVRTVRVPLMFETEDAPPKPTAPRMVRSPMAEAKERAGVHEPQASALVLQLWEHDKEPACELAELIADIEPEFRHDLLFVFAPQQGTVIDERVRRAMLHVGRKMKYTQLWAQVDPRKSYPGVCFDPWLSILNQLVAFHAKGELAQDSAFFFEADGCPASKDWIDKLTKSHRETVAQGKVFTGAIMTGDYFDRHMNGSLVAYLPEIQNIPSLQTCPDDQAWDIWHGNTICSRGRDTRRILNEYNLSFTEQSFAQMGREAAWFSSNKDRTAHLWARRLLVKG